MKQAGVKIPKWWGGWGALEKDGGERRGGWGVWCHIAFEIKHKYIISPPLLLLYINSNDSGASSYDTKYVLINSLSFDKVQRVCRPQKKDDGITRKMKATLPGTA